jgi:hypothetical protein
MRLEIAGLIGMIVGCNVGGSCPDPVGGTLTFDVSCLRDTGTETDTGPPDCQALCEAAAWCNGFRATRVDSCALGDETVACTGEFDVLCKGGRRPPALVPFRSRARSPIRRWATQAAWLEAASVPAFVRLARELEHHGAPALAARARAAARDEVRHARAVATAFGVRVPRVRVHPLPLRDLDAIAVDNAVEGCSGETLGAAVALHQSLHADPPWRPLFAAIAADELRHAQLAWDIDRWLGPHARPDLRRFTGGGVPLPGLGLPGPELATRLGAALLA